MSINCSVSKYSPPPGQGWGHGGECHLTSAEGWRSACPSKPKPSSERGKGFSGRAGFSQDPGGNTSWDGRGAGSDVRVPVGRAEPWGGFCRDRVGVRRVFSKGSPLAVWRDSSGEPGGGRRAAAVKIHAREEVQSSLLAEAQLPRNQSVRSRWHRCGL